MRVVRYRLDASCEACIAIRAFRAEMPRGVVPRPDMILVDVENPRALARHPHLWTRQCGGRFNRHVRAAMDLLGVEAMV